MNKRAVVKDLEIFLKALLARMIDAKKTKDITDYDVRMELVDEFENEMLTLREKWENYEDEDD